MDTNTESLEGSLYREVEWFKSNGEKPAVENCIPFLTYNNLMIPGSELKIRSGKEFIEAEELLGGLPTQRSLKKSKSEINSILSEFKNLISNHKLKTEQMDEIWTTFRNPKDFYLFDASRISSDALAFYRPFHFSPDESWGIYLLVDKLLKYYFDVKENLGAKQYLFQSDIL